MTLETTLKILYIKDSCLLFYLCAHMWVFLGLDQLYFEPRKLQEHRCQPALSQMSEISLKAQERRHLTLETRCSLSRHH